MSRFSLFHPSIHHPLPFKAGRWYCVTLNLSLTPSDRKGVRVGVNVFVLGEGGEKRSFLTGSCKHRRAGRQRKSLPMGEWQGGRQGSPRRDQSRLDCGGVKVQDGDPRTRCRDVGDQEGGERYVVEESSVVSTSGGRGGLQVRGRLKLSLLR